MATILLIIPLFILLLIVNFSGVHSSYCGQAAIPFTLQILSNGQPVLGCARPSCFGWNANGEVAGDSARFYRIQKKNDGYLRDGDSEKKVFAKSEFYRSQTSECQATYESTSCDMPNQWVGGIAPLYNVTNAPFLMKCCAYDGLSLSTDRGTAQVAPGQILVGGEVLKNRRQYAFDYIANIRRNVDEDDTSALLNLLVEERVASFVKSMDYWIKKALNKTVGEPQPLTKKQMQKFKPEKIAKEPIAFKKDKTPPPEDDEEDAATNEKGDDEKILELLEAERNGAKQSAEIEESDDEESTATETLPVPLIAHIPLLNKPESAPASPPYNQLPPISPTTKPLPEESRYLGSKLSNQMRGLMMGQDDIHYPQTPREHNTAIQPQNIPSPPQQAYPPTNKGAGKSIKHLSPTSNLK
ncbi:unnamed protein product [Enterobius vermicularis]|uniref:WxxW domain-containing protein n=1 Tax=Enterobius vermicularis TaxID=51028 RepID=A0A0N4VGF5_ENTVE|nr:unnamed protein product [Enterobius vermicularis]